MLRKLASYMMIGHSIPYYYYVCIAIAISVLLGHTTPIGVHNIMTLYNINHYMANNIITVISKLASTAVAIH